MREAWLVVLLALSVRASVARQPARVSVPASCETSRESPLPLPITIPPERLAEHEQQVLAFLKAGTYVQLGWCGDKAVRDTGPWIAGASYGTHMAVS